MSTSSVLGSTASSGSLSLESDPNTVPKKLPHAGDGKERKRKHQKKKNANNQPPSELSVSMKIPTHVHNGTLASPRSINSNESPSSSLSSHSITLSSQSETPSLSSNTSTGSENATDSSPLSPSFRDESTDIDHDEATDSRFTLSKGRSEISFSQILGATTDDFVVKNLDDDDVSVEQKSKARLLHNRYLKGPLIGKGSFAAVKECYDIDQQTVVAIKIFNWGGKEEEIDKNIKGLFDKEVEIMRTSPVKNRNVISYIDSWTENKKGYIVLEYFDRGTVADLILAANEKCETKAMPVDQVRCLFKSLVLGMKALLDQGMHHLDIKPDNMLLRSAREVCISDLGNVSKSRRSSNHGAVLFLCPEIYHSHEKSVSEKVDVWAAGITLYVMLFGKYPFVQMDDSAIEWVEELHKGNDPFLSTASDNIKDLMTKLLCVDPEKRISISEILEHPWLQEVPKKGKSESSSSTVSSCSSFSSDCGAKVCNGFVLPAKRKTFFTRSTVDYLLRQLKSTSQMSHSSVHKPSPLQMGPTVTLGKGLSSDDDCSSEEEKDDKKENSHKAPNKSSKKKKKKKKKKTVQKASISEPSKEPVSNKPAEVSKTDDSNNAIHDHDKKLDPRVPDKQEPVKACCTLL